MAEKRKQSKASRLRAKLPEHMRIGVYRWTLIMWDPEIAEAANCVGECNKMSLEIRVRTDITDTRFAECLMHEIVHACWFVVGLGDEEEEEAAVERLTHALLQARRDNPEVFKFIDTAISEA